MTALQLCDKMPSPMGESAVDCGDLSSMPTVSFSIGGRTFDLAPEEVWCTRTYLVAFARADH